MAPEQKECMRLRKTYGVHIHPIYNRQKFFPKHWLRVPVSAKGTQIAPKEMDRLAKIFEEYKPNMFPSFTSTIKGKHRLNMLIKIPSEKWINKKLADLLRNLPMPFTVNVEPEDIL